MSNVLHSSVQMVFVAVPSSTSAVIQGEMVIFAIMSTSPLFGLECELIKIDALDA